MPAYVPNYKHDLFVSYAHVDNRPRIRGDVDSMWVTTFTNQLRIVISQKLGRSDLDDSTFLPEAEAEADADIDALGRSMDPTFQPILDRLNALSGQLADFREGVSQSIKVAEVDPEMALTRTRKVLERLIHAVYNRQIKTSPGTQPLEGLLQRLRKDGFLPSKIYAHATAVKDLGNVGAHSHAEHVSPADVVHSLTALLYVLEWYSEEEPDPAGEVPLPKPTRQPTVEGPAPAIEQAISSAATLLVILSEGHLQSERCRRELDMFLQARGGIEAARGRIFVAARDEIERSRWPVEFQDLIGYEFYEKTAEGRVHTLAVPKLTPDEELYFTRLDDISMDLVQRLKQLAHGFSPGSPQAASAPASTTAYSGCVFLGDVIPELDSTREEVKRHLMHVNLRVLPETFYSRTPSDYRAALERGLGGSGPVCATAGYGSGASDRRLSPRFFRAAARARLVPAKTHPAVA